MKKVLIIGENSYVGNSLIKWLNNFPNSYITSSISVRDNFWKEEDFSVFDVVVHVAGIAHIKETKENTSLYYKVNRDLAIEVAQKAKNEGVNQFIFLSTMSVYGKVTGVINKDTELKPNNNYGKSKLQAEKLISSLEEDLFKVAILRPPMIYGKGCKGNYTRLAKAALQTPLFPNIENKRSMIYIDNLSEFIRDLIDNSRNGLFFPQNNEYVNTSEMVRLIAEVHGKKIRMTNIFNPLIKLLKINTINKLFGDLVYEKEITGYCEQISLEDSIKLTEK